ncbi:hypothetical protein PIB30_005042 [Stylosanthes scabra]|uniref:Uncharacterized protein n=1 Tax=Stylosanthes scabra TaxID=79078 RepID=A0ABU6Z0M9_9FABA|nr:hypothetical protein [Stylosanthes scabra]
MTSSFKTYIFSFVLLLAFVLSSHVLTHELPQEDINDEEVNPIEELTNDLSIKYNPKALIGPQPNDEYDEDYGDGSRGSRCYGDHWKGSDNDDDDDCDDYDDDSDDDTYYTNPHHYHNHRRYDDHSDEKYYTDPRNYHNHHHLKGHSSEFVHSQSSNLHNTKLKPNNWDESIKKHSKIMDIPSKFDFWSSIPHKGGDKKGNEEVNKKTMS